jgi:hypothetical protein
MWGHFAIKHARCGVPRDRMVERTMHGAELAAERRCAGGRRQAHGRFPALER